MTTPQTVPARYLPVSFDDAREIVADLLGPAWRVLPDGYVSQEDTTYLVRYEPADPNDPGWDLDVLTVEAKNGMVTRIPWQLGVGLPNRMKPISASS